MPTVRKSKQWAGIATQEFVGRRQTPQAKPPQENKKGVYKGQCYPDSVSAHVAREVIGFGFIPNLRAVLLLAACQVARFGRLLEEKLVFPFKARCVAVRSLSPLKKGEEVEVIAMAKEDDCMREILVLIEFAGRRLGVPLSQLEVIEANGETRQAVEDWCYWAARGYAL